jgi:hypothetical protein
MTLEEMGVRKNVRAQKKKEGSTSFCGTAISRSRNAAS